MPGAFDLSKFMQGPGGLGLSMLANNQPRPYHMGPNTMGSALGQGGMDWWQMAQQQKQLAEQAAYRKQMMELRQQEVAARRRAEEREIYGREEKRVEKEGDEEVKASNVAKEHARDLNEKSNPFSDASFSGTQDERRKAIIRAGDYMKSQGTLMRPGEQVQYDAAKAEQAQIDKDKSLANQRTEQLLNKTEKPTARVIPSPQGVDLDIAGDLIDADEELSKLDNKPAFKRAVAAKAKEISRKELVDIHTATQLAIEELRGKIKPGKETGWFDLELDEDPSFDPSRLSDEELKKIANGG